MSEEYFNESELNDNDKYSVGVGGAASAEDEFFRSVYIGTGRENDNEIVEVKDKLNIRGLEYNLKEVNFMVTYVKRVFTNKDKKQKTVCFSYKDGRQPFHGYDGRECPSNSSERRKDDFCSRCREEIIVSGPLCDKKGKMVMNGDHPVFVFLRGKGVKYFPVCEFIDSLANEKFEKHLLEQNTSSNRFKEKRLINHKRYIINVTVGEYESNFGTKKIFVLERGNALPFKTVGSLVKMVKVYEDEFEEKFDWGKRRRESVKKEFTYEDKDKRNEANENDSPFMEGDTEGDLDDLKTFEV